MTCPRFESAGVLAVRIATAKLSRLRLEARLIVARAPVISDAQRWSARLYVSARRALGLGRQGMAFAPWCGYACAASRRGRRARGDLSLLGSGNLAGERAQRGGGCRLPFGVCAARRA